MQPRPFRRVLALGALAACSTAAAGSFSISPIRIEFGAGAGTQVLTVRNEEDRPVVVQLRTVAWSQIAGADRLDDTRDLLATPPVFTLPAGGQQIIRIALRRSADASRELAYRLLLEEVPQPAPKDFTGLQVALRLSLPVFVHAPRRSGPVATWSAAWQPDGRLALRLRNDGNVHLQMLDFDVQPAATAGAVLHNSVARYVLPGSEAEWLLEPPAGAPRFDAARIRGTSDQGALDAAITVAAP